LMHSDDKAIGESASIHELERRRVP
jgi:hypothetical protein